MRWVCVPSIIAKTKCSKSRTKTLMAHRLLAPSYPLILVPYIPQAYDPAEYCGGLHDAALHPWAYPRPHLQSLCGAACDRRPAEQEGAHGGHVIQCLSARVA